ncbi:MAG: hypothetical protein K5829_00765 [Treponema sp.]|nr:hypothetical protein [Treponema sp.]
MKKFFVFLTSVFLIFSFISCTSEITIAAKENGALEVTFTGQAGQSFSKLINSASGGEGEVVVFDTKQISYELSKYLFSDVKVESKNGSDLSISMKDNDKKSVLYSSDLIKCQKGKLSASLSPKKLMTFYNAGDEDIVQFLDLLLAPVFNDEILTEEEYLDTISSFYGESVAREIGETNFKITLINADGKEIVKLIPLASLLSLHEEVIF